MQLYSVLHSPYSARVRIQVYDKDLPVEIVEPPGFRTPEYKKINPTGKVPALVLEERLLPESSVIMEYLEDRFPDPAMRPTDIDERATMNLFYRFSDSYIQPALFPLFSQVFQKTADAETLKGHITALKQQVLLLDQLMGEYGREIEHSIDLADCTFASNFFFARVVPSWFEEGVDVLEGAPRVQAWWDWCNSNEHTRRVLGELETGFNAFLERMNFKK